VTPGGEPSFVVFDLDGTLIDGYAAIGDALGFAMRRLGVPELSPERVRAMVGRGLETLLEDAVGAERAAEGVCFASDIRRWRSRSPTSCPTSGASWSFSWGAATRWRSPPTSPPASLG
jgi:Haloacid dehalogenase-like hydrolase